MEQVIEIWMTSTNLSCFFSNKYKIRFYTVHYTDAHNNSSDEFMSHEVFDLCGTRKKSHVEFIKYIVLRC